MGLDQSLISRPRHQDYELGDWRKFNALQNYIERNIARSDDINCKDIPMNEEQINDLLVILRKVHADHSLAEELFPNTTGFFYGSQEYDDWYFQDIERTIEIFEQALKEIDKSHIIYSCWY